MFAQRLALGLVAAIAMLGVAPAQAQAIETPAREAALMDFETGQILFGKRENEPMPPASMTKIMTAYLVFERLKDGRLSLDDTFRVSKKAWRKGGSKMFVEVGKEITVENLLKGMIVQSGNDASIVLAEGIAGTETAFAEMMTAKAEELGMDNTVFKNSTGWPDPDHYSSAEDLAILARNLIRNFPEYYHMYSQREFTWNDIRQFNRNPLLRRNMGVDGLKTGYTQNAGYGLTASAKRDGRRLILVVNGLKTPKQRASESARLMELGFREFATYTLFEANETVDEASVWLGEAGTVPLVIEQSLQLALKRDARNEMTVRVTYDSPIPAPIEAGERLATLEVEVPGQQSRTVPLVAGATVAQLGPIGRVVSGVEFLIFGAP
jgi:D-alanyl-D-alanine carboxypeptidase (penicillin-binding protein 5/6)